MSERYIAIGDIHGRFDLLQLLLRKITARLFEREVGEWWTLPDIVSLSHKLVFLGDYVDRGPDSFQVIDTIKHLVDTGKALALLGNHETMMLDFYRNRRADWHDIWMHNGGRKTVESYGKSMKLYGLGHWFEAFGKSGHASFLNSLPYFHETDEVWFSHAPIPDEETARWLPLVSHVRVRDYNDFRANTDLLTWTYVMPGEKAEGTWERRHGKLAACGHIHGLQNSSELSRLQPRIYPHIVYADTGSGCAPWGRLSAVVIEDGKFVEFIQAAPDEVPAVA